MEEIKIKCRKCKEEKSVREMKNDSRYKLGFQKLCKNCENERHKNYRESQKEKEEWKEKEKQRHQKYNEEHKEEIKERQKKFLGQGGWWWMGGLDGSPSPALIG